MDWLLGFSPVAILQHRQLDVTANREVRIEVDIGVNLFAFGLFSPSRFALRLIFFFIVELVF
jgi:hypothetical protein